MRMDSATTRLQNYLHAHIPLSKAMQVEAIFASAEAIVLGAPLEPNINHRETVFGGSASALAILSAWSLLHTRLQAEHVACIRSCDLVVRQFHASRLTMFEMRSVSICSNACRWSSL